MLFQAVKAELRCQSFWPEKQENAAQPLAGILSCVMHSRQEFGLFLSVSP